MERKVQRPRSKGALGPWSGCITGRFVGREMGASLGRRRAGSAGGVSYQVQVFLFYPVDNGELPSRGTAPIFYTCVALFAKGFLGHDYLFLSWQQSCKVGRAGSAAEEAGCCGLKTTRSEFYTEKPSPSVRAALQEAGEGAAPASSPAPQSRDPLVTLGSRR